jgi:short-subunit dehydrogenase
VIVDDNLEKIERVAEEVRSDSVSVSVVCAKTCENHDVFRLFDDVNEKFGDVDLLVS